MAFVALAFATVACAAAPAEKTAGHPATPAAVSATPRMHPKGAPAERAIVLVNPGFESDRLEPTADPEGWFTGQHAGAVSYLFVLDTTVKHRGEQSMRIDNVGPEPYGSVGQILPGTPYAGKTVRFSGWLRTVGAEGVGASLFINAEGGGVFEQNLMEGSEVKGTREWARYSITLPLPLVTERLRVGATFRGKGSAWFDDAELEVVGPR